LWKIGSCPARPTDVVDPGLAAEPTCGGALGATLDRLRPDDALVAPGADPAKSVKLFDLVNRQTSRPASCASSVTDSTKYAHGGVLVPSEHHIADVRSWTADAIAD
jgi:hypothetical protein